MHEEPNLSPDGAELRRQAEKRLRELHSQPGSDLSETDTERLVHELQVHQIELEMQNEELQQARNTAEAGLEKYSDLYDFAPVGYLTLDREGTVCEANLTAASLLQIERSRLVKRRFGVHVAAPDIPVFNDFLNRVFESQATEGAEVTLLKQGKPAVAVRIEAKAAAAGRECRAVLEDITERKRAEEALAETQAALRSFYESAPMLMGLVELTEEDQIIHLHDNPATARFLGMDYGNTKAKPASELGVSSNAIQEWARHYRESQAQRRPIQFEYLHPSPRGARWLSATVSAIGPAGPAGRMRFSYVAEDITERKQDEANQLILSKLESTGILAGGIAHDFNNLLTVILLNLELAQTLGPPGEEMALRLDEAKQAALASRRLTQQLITFAKGGAPNRKPTSLSGLIREAVRPSLSGSRTRCELSLEKDLWPAEVDAGQIGQVIQNMVLNAREAMPEGGAISVRAENVVLEALENSSLPPGDYVRLSITDQGCGIAKDVLPKIFDPYFSTKQRGDQKGMGLGLTICHTVMQKHGGTIIGESELGVGSTFKIYLPATRKTPAKERAAVPAIQPRPGRILVMDDEEGVRSVVGMILRRLGHEVELVEEGSRAIAVYQEARRQDCPFDAVLLDLTVRDGVGGQEAIQALLQIDPAVKAIVTSGYAHDSVVLEPERYGFKGALLKPFNISKLQDILARVIGPGSSEEDSRNGETAGGE